MDVFIDYSTWYCTYRKTGFCTNYKGQQDLKVEALMNGITLSELLE